MYRGEEAEYNRLSYKQAELFVKIRKEKQPRLGYLRDTYANKIIMSESIRGLSIQ